MKDTRLVRIALFLILVAFSLIYALFFMVQWDAVKKDFQSIFLHWWVVNSSDVQSASQFSGEVVASIGSGGEWEIANQSNSNDSSLVTETPDSFMAEVLSTETTGEKILSWTTLYYGSLDILKTLWIRYEYILKDKNYNIYYVYVGQKWADYSLPEIIKAVWGESIEIYAKNAIINNLYFGDRVTFATLPNQLSTQTNLFVRIGEDLWFIQDLTGEYKQNKKHIRYIFTNK